MKTLPMRAKGVYSEQWHIFYLQDIPVRIENDVFILLNRARSPKLLFNEVHVGCEEYGVFEGDVVQSGSKQYLVLFDGGFYLTDMGGNVCYLHDVPDITVQSTYHATAFAPLFKRSHAPIFRYESSLFLLADISCGFSETLYISGNDAEIPVYDVHQSSGVMMGGRPVFFGDTTPYGEVRMQGGRIVAGSDAYDLRKRGA